VRTVTGTVPVVAVVGVVTVRAVPSGATVNPSAWTVSVPKVTDVAPSRAVPEMTTWLGVALGPSAGVSAVIVGVST